MIRSQCDNCHVLGDAPPPPGWIMATEVTEPEPAEDLGLLSGGMSTETAGMFCSYACLGDYARAKALVESAGSGEGSQP